MGGRSHLTLFQEYQDPRGRGIPGISLLRYSGSAIRGATADHVLNFAFCPTLYCTCCNLARGYSCRDLVGSDSDQHTYQIVSAKQDLVPYTSSALQDFGTITPKLTLSATHNNRDNTKN